MAATFLRKYNTAVSGTSVISIPLIKAGVTNFAVGADITFTAGDVVISRDGGSWGNIANLPIARTAGNAAVFDFILTGTETQAAQTRVMISDAATKAIEDDYFIVEFFGNVSGMHSIDYSTISQDTNGYLYADLASVSGTRIPSPNVTGIPIVDLYLINGVPVNTSLAQIGTNVVKWSGVSLPNAASDSLGYPKMDVAAWSGTIIPNQTTAGIPDVNLKNILGTQSSGTGGFVGLDWANITNKTTTVNLSNTAISGIETYTGNTKQTGDAFARIGAAGISLTSIVASSVLGNVGGNVLGNLNGNILGFVNVSGINLTVQNTLIDNLMTRQASNWEAAGSGTTLSAVIAQSLNSAVNSNTLEIKKTDNTLLMTKTLIKTSDNPIRSIS